MGRLRRAFLASDEAVDQELERLYEQDRRFWDSLDDESDRGMALASGAYFEYILENCLESYFDDCPVASELLQSTAGLKSFKARIKCCRALRIIDDDELRSLDMISRIRNKIAHDLSKQFTSDDITDSVFSLLQHLYPNEPPINLRAKYSVREAFRISCLVVSLDLLRREVSVMLHTRDYPYRVPDYVGINNSTDTENS
jgi:hypothetical protein